MVPRILVIGSSNMDLILPVNKIPAAGESVLSEHYKYIPGGKGANAAVAAARLGADAIFCTRVGEDANGSMLIETLRKERLDTRFISRDKKKPTGLAAVLLEETRESRIIVYPGANTALSIDDIENAFLSYPDALYMPFELSPDIIMAAAAYAKRQDIPIFLDAGPARSDLDLAKLGGVEIISPNETEMEAMTGILPSNEKNCVEACMKLRRMVDAAHIVLKLSNRGCFLYDGKYCEFLPAYNVRAVDSTAAGDAFTAALTLEYMRTHDLVHSCKYANIVGALTVTTLGAISSLPTSQDVAEFVRVNEIKL